MKPQAITLMAGLAFLSGRARADSDFFGKRLVPMDQDHPIQAWTQVTHGVMVDLGPSGGQAYLARPSGVARATLLLVHDVSGLTNAMRVKADDLAELGYAVLAIDLYRGRAVTAAGGAVDPRATIDATDAERIEKAGTDYLTSQYPRARMGIIGWSMGAAFAFQAALQSPNNVHALVMYYGVPTTAVDRFRSLRAPVLGIWAKEDRSITPDTVSAFDRALTTAGVEHDFHSYDADHGFADPTRADAASAAAGDANDLVEQFLGAHLL
jgi:carboxymethylenebutenolidase